MISDELNLPDASGDSGNKLFAPENENNSNAEVFTIVPRTCKTWEKPAET
jgi:hypothetical protein